MGDEKRDRWKELKGLHKELENFIEDEFAKIEEEVKRVKALLEPSWSVNGVLRPLYSIRESPLEHVIYVDIPRADEGSVEVTFTGNKVRVKAKLRKEVRLEGLLGRGSETSFTHYEQVIELPFEVDPRKVKVRVRKGVVEVRIRK